MPVFNFYGPETFRLSWKKFMKICDREDESAAHKLRKFVEQYNDRHDKGNPQITFDTLLNMPQKECERCEELFDNVWRVKYLSDVIMKSCRSCIDEDKSKGLVKRVLSLVG